MSMVASEYEATRERVLDQAIGLIEQRGGNAVTMPELAARSGLSPVNLTRFFENREAVLDAVAGRWFAPKITIMEDVVASDLPPRRKLYEFFAQRFVRLRESWRADRVAFDAYCEIGAENFEAVRGYVDLADHYQSLIVAEAMADGYFAGLSIDEAVSLINQMVIPYVAIDTMRYVMERLSEDKLALIVDAIFDGLSAQDRGAKGLSGLRAA